MTARYRYIGPSSGTTIGDKEVLLHPGHDVALDPGHPYTNTLLALGHLAPLPEKPVPPARRGKPEEAA